MTLEYKTIIMGSLGVGKSSFATQMLEKEFVDNFDPFFQDERRMEYHFEGKDCLLSILDTSVGVEYPDNMRDSYWLMAAGFLVVYSITARSTFEEVEGWVFRLVERRREKKIPMVLCGNKCDLEKYRQVEREEGEELARALNCPFFESSAKELVNVEECFRELVIEIKKRNYPPNYRQGKVERECGIQ